MKKFMFFVWLAVLPLCFCGCEQFTDSIRNQTANPVRVQVIFASGVTNDQLEVWGTNYPGSGIVLRRPVRIESLGSHLIPAAERLAIFPETEFPATAVNMESRLIIMIFDDGIFPVAKSCEQTGTALVSEDQVKSVFKSETVAQ